MEVTANIKNIRISPQKLKLVADQIKKTKPKDSVKILDFIPNKSSRIVKKAILSAMANARNNFGHKEESLIFKQIIISKGPVFERFRPIARGRVHPILKRTSHLKVVLEAVETNKKENKEEDQNQKTSDDKGIKGEKKDDKKERRNEDGSKS